MALAFLVRLGTGWIRQAARVLGFDQRRDVGERVAERYLRATGHRIVGRNWRSPRDARDEADLLALTPCRTTLLVVEVKRAAGPWDALDRVDARKRAVLWRLLGDLRAVHARDAEREHDDGQPDHPCSGWRVHSPIRRALQQASRLRCDLIGVEGVDGRASVVRHHTDLLSIGLAGPRSTLAGRTRSPPTRASNP